MTVETVRKWTCDRCGIVIETPPNRPPADDWIGVALNRTAIDGSWDHEGWTREHWCGTCHVDLRIWLRDMPYRADRERVSESPTTDGSAA